MHKTSILLNQVMHDLYVNEDDKIEYAFIYRLYVHPLMRDKGIGRALMDAAVEEIKKAHPKLPIKIHLEPFGSGGLTQAQLLKFYSSYDVEIVNKGDLCDG